MILRELASLLAISDACATPRLYRLRPSSATAISAASPAHFAYAAARVDAHAFAVHYAMPSKRFAMLITGHRSIAVFSNISDLYREQQRRSLARRADAYTLAPIFTIPFRNCRHDYCQEEAAICSIFFLFTTLRCRPPLQCRSLILRRCRALISGTRHRRR